MNEYLAQIKNRIRHLIDRVRKDLTMDLRIKVITIDVHERDVVLSFVNKKIEDIGSFA